MGQQTEDSTKCSPRTRPSPCFRKHSPRQHKVVQQHPSQTRQHRCSWVMHTSGFGEKGKPASGDEGVVPPNATLNIILELLSWKKVSTITDDKKVVKKILKEVKYFIRSL